ncbi:DmsC/YnfH family molybdoenzyme membrane anchor subunit [Bythopirellula goksoeyrii]|uniref:Anaerobic dimethyl sulfoxide reductase chain B n=1 Tax=Bythopirellula goksoeyrii TaxID=1400387 RepID=A0A5B9QE30_9BACT|nr:DmsC/YnfH family molybdoenzyme membrane anchor subunit [Bythopirellula goksoeyrii]QEG37228.1 Anaerobic dimethyl sulfoxide reductase chain B [Bythopirellula goksoeyrii]
MAAVAESPTSRTNGFLVNALLDEQQRTTVVERFSQRHSTATEPLLAGHYQDLIPLSKPKPGEQYAFEVDLDACSGCKACVVACHNLNGLDESEQWRKVGLLHGGSEQLPVLQHITTACHHCVDPACLSGCPVMAYDKDPETGIVRHLDDQCIGCQYCIFMCPYDVPHYNPGRGIVRKCDMCHDRLAVGEAPACVQSCPNGAIRIRTVSTESVIAESESNQFLPTAPEPGITLPTTSYKSSKPLPRNLLPADYYSANRQHSHLALVFMLVLTQLSVGAFIVGQVLVSGPWADQLMLTAIRPAYAIAGLVVGLLGMNAAVFHLGRPLYAFRALLGLRTSWLSREILAFGVFAAAALAYAAAVWFAGDHPGLVPWADRLGLATAITGAVGVLCSVMIYVKTQRPFWTGSRTGSKFLLTCLVLGLPIALLVSLVACVWNQQLTAHSIMQNYGQSLCKALMIVVAMKLLFETAVLARLKQRQFTPLKRTALLLTGELSMTNMLRYFFGIMGGLLLPLVLLSHKATTVGEGAYQPLFMGFIVILIAGLLLIGELLERYLFFAASVAPKMPGAP